MSQIFSSYTLGQLWDSSHLFDLSHTYLKHGTVMGSNICEWKQKYLWMDNFPSYLFVYRQANLCSGLRVTIVLNYKKRISNFWAYFRGSGTARIRTRIAGFEADCSTNYAMSRWWKLMLSCLIIWLVICTIWRPKKAGL